MQFDSVSDLPRAYGEPLASAQLKSTPSDFIVREALGFELDGEGEHLYLHIRKCGLNTSDVLEQLQREFQCGSVDIGVSGLKDKNAVTDQWFSVRSSKRVEDTSLKCASMVAPLAANTSGNKNPLDTSESSVDINVAVPQGEYIVLESHRHSRKLRRGAHRHNRFIITLRHVAAPDLKMAQNAIDHRLKLISEHGFVNYFGPQRFGINQQNLVKAERYFANPKRKISRVQRGLLISSARSLLFNQVCAERVKQSNWNVPLTGEPMLLDGSHSFFVNNSDSDGVDKNNTVARCLAHDVHPTGPLWGQGDALSIGECRQFETNILQKYKVFTDGLEKAGLKQQRRALRAGVEQLKWHWQEPEVLTINFNLLKGVYATSFLSEIMIN